MSIQAPPQPASDAVAATDVVVDSAYAVPHSPPELVKTPLTTRARLAVELFALFPFVASLDLFLHGDWLLNALTAMERANHMLPYIAKPAMWLAAHPIATVAFAGVHALCLWGLVKAGLHRGALFFGGLGSFASLSFIYGLWGPFNTMLDALSTQPRSY